VLFDRQVHHLDRLAGKSRQRGHTSINRASLIRGLIDGMLMSGIDLSVHATEAAVREDIARRLRRAARSL
jgi:hypothetical protein